MKVPNERLSGNDFSQARRYGGHSGTVSPKSFLCPPNFVVLRKICFKHTIKTKISPLKVYFAFPKPQNLAIGLVLSKLCLQLEYFVLKSTQPRDAPWHNFFYKSPLVGPLEAFGGSPELGWYGTVGYVTTGSTRHFFNLFVQFFYLFVMRSFCQFLTNINCLHAISTQDAECNIYFFKHSESVKDF